MALVIFYLVLRGILCKVGFTFLMNFQAESIIIKQTWVKELRELIQQFQFGILRAKGRFPY